jgi:hypothetical protein
MSSQVIDQVKDDFDSILYCLTDFSCVDKAFNKNVLNHLFSYRDYMFPTVDEISRYENRLVSMIVEMIITKTNGIVKVDNDSLKMIKRFFKTHYENGNRHQLSNMLLMLVKVLYRKNLIEVAEKIVWFWIPEEVIYYLTETPFLFQNGDETQLIIFGELYKTFLKEICIDESIYNIFSRYISIDMVDEAGKSALSYALINSNYDFAKELLSNGASLNVEKSDQNNFIYLLQHLPPSDERYSYYRNKELEQIINNLLDDKVKYYLSLFEVHYLIKNSSLYKLEETIYLLKNKYSYFDLNDLFHNNVRLYGFCESPEVLDVLIKYGAKLEDPEHKVLKHLLKKEKEYLLYYLFRRGYKLNKNINTLSNDERMRVMYHYNEYKDYLFKNIKQDNEIDIIMSSVKTIIDYM